MRNGSLLFSAVQFLVIAALFFGGAAFFVLHYLPHTRLGLSDWIMQPDQKFLLLGYLVIGLGLLLTVSFWVMQRGRYLRLQMDKGNFSVDEALVKELIDQFWREELPEKNLPSEVYFACQKIEVITQGVEKDLEQIEERLGALLSKQLGYEKEFFVTCSSVKGEPELS